MIESGAIVERSKVLSDGGVAAWWIPTYLAETHPELTTIEGILANSKLVGNRFHNCPTGCMCQRVSSNITKAAGFADARGENFNNGAGEALAASIASACDSKEPWFG
nr:glycine betaine ABC transporter substrate-binding protein [Ruegeria arenilitoris]